MDGRQTKQSRDLARLLRQHLVNRSDISEGLEEMLDIIKIRHRNDAPSEVVDILANLDRELARHHKAAWDQLVRWWESPDGRRLQEEEHKAYLASELLASVGESDPVH